MTVAIDYKNAKGWLTSEETEWLFQAAQSLPDNATILNIGVEYGKSLACLRAGNLTSRIIGVDLDINKVLGNGYDCALVQIDSALYFEAWHDPIDLIFVDGDHGYNGVMLDSRFAQWLPVGGVIAFQDCFDWEDYTKIHALCPGVNVAVQDWFDAHRFEFDELESVGTTRISRRVSNVVAESSVLNPDIQPGRVVSKQPAKAKTKR